MRTLIKTALAAPFVALLFLSRLARRSLAAQLVLLVSVGVVVVGAAAAWNLSRPVPATATRPAAPITALPDVAFQSVRSATELRAPVTIRFSEAMDQRSVAASLRISPATTVQIGWNADRTELTLRPASHWAAGVYHSVAVDPGALAATGRPMARTVRAAFVTRPTTTGRIEATRAAGADTSVASAFRITLDHHIGQAAVAAALVVDPPVAGTLVADPVPPAPAFAPATSFTFTPAVRLAGGRTYRLSLVGLVDADGSTASVPSFETTTSPVPRVLRVRPSDGAVRVGRQATISVRFSERMTSATTRASLRVTVGGRAVKGTYRFAEAGRLLTFRPSAALPAGRTVSVRVDGSATSADGVPLGRTSSVQYRTVPAVKKAPPVSTTARAVAPRAPTSSSGGSVGGGSWAAVERYYLNLMNCTRTGGWVTSGGSCSSPGGRNVAPLRLDAGISSNVSRPYARRLAVNNLCTHFSGGNPGDRLRRAGYTSYVWAENLGCRSGSATSAVLGSHLFFQSEKSYLGGHYVNLMNAKYDRVGIGVWVAGGRVRLVVDFYHPR